MPNSALPECNGTGRCATLRAPRPGPLHHRANRAQMKPGLSSSPDETKGSAQIHLSFMFGILGMSELKKFREKGYRNSKRFTGMPKESNRLRNALTFERLAKYSSRYL